MSKQLNIHLFNCDRTYKLKVVEDWLKEGRKTTKSELGIDLTVESRDFSLSEMTQLSDKTIPGLGIKFTKKKGRKKRTKKKSVQWRE